MKTHQRWLIVGLAVLSASIHQTAAQGTAFTYQGRLNNGTNPVTGSYDLTFALFSVGSGGSAVAGPLTNSPTGVTNGLFTVMLDFGAGVFPGADRWLDIAVRTNGTGVFTNLTPRQKITSTPYAVQALGAGSAASYTGAISDNQLSANVARLNGSNVFSGAVQFNNTNDVFKGSFLGNGAGMTNSDPTLNSAGMVTWGAFSLASSPGVGLNPSSVTAADVNGDGKMDLICANNFTNTLSVLTNNGSGGFVLASSPVVGFFGPISVTAADVNGDGKVDLICANFANSGILSVLTNNGVGGFVLASTLNVGARPGSVTTADVNGDGKVDLICANLGDNTLSVLTNNGSGGFALASTPAVGNLPRSVVAADVKGDGKQDLI